ncbi:MAG: maleylacetate reductase [Pseudomonadota bacterium]|jgi:alcohol dehydrogenase class IV
MQPFAYQPLPMRVHFEPGALARIGDELQALGLHRAIVLCTPDQAALAERVVTLLGPRAAGVFDQAQQHVPIETARQAQALAQALGADCAVAVGGGSTIGLGKAIALDSGLPVIAIPTTYAGSEMTSIYGITESGLKKTGRDARVLPRSVLYDPELTQSLPVELSVTSGINAIAHAAEGLYASDGNPVIGLMAQEGIAALGRALPRIHRDPHDQQARHDALYGAWLCGAVLGNVSMALHHKLCHTLGGSFNLPHAQTHTVVLPHALAYNEGAAPEAMRRVAAALNASRAPAAIFDLARDHGAPVTLQALGLREQDLDRACDLALNNQYPNPRRLEREGLRALLQNAFEGRRPA